MLEWNRPKQNGKIPRNRSDHVSVTFGKSFYIFGGREGKYHFNDMHVYNTENSTWSQITYSNSDKVPKERAGNVL